MRQYESPNRGSRSSRAPSVLAALLGHPSGKAYAGGPQMVEISRDGKRVYSTGPTRSIPPGAISSILTACQEPR
jgi:56kDa selenium binding protein (SBP56)